MKGDLFIAEGANAGVLIRYAYDLKDFQLAGGPNWIRDRDTQFTIQGRLAGEARLDRVRLMVQQLLAERFQLKTHMERRAGTLYELTVARGGAKLAASLVSRRHAVPRRGRCWLLQR